MTNLISQKLSKRSSFSRIRQPSVDIGQPLAKTVANSEENRVRGLAAQTAFPIAFLLACLLSYLPGPTTAFSQPLAQRRLILEGYEFEGLTKTSPNIILQYLSLKPGDVLTPELLDDDRQRLDRINFFTKVDLSTRPGSEKGRVVVVIEVEERKWPYFQFEGGHSDLSGWYIAPVGFRFDNAFGHGSRFGIRLLIGDDMGKVSLFYRNRLFRNRAFIDMELHGGAEVFRQFIGDDELQLGVGLGGLKVKLGGTQGFLKHLFLQYRATTFEPDEFARDENGDKRTNLPLAITDDFGKNETTALALGLHADTRDNPLFPLKGFWGALVAESVTTGLEGRDDYPRLTFDARLFHEVMRRRVVAVHIKGGYTTRDAPFYERFYLGGANSVRGYPNRRLTPIGWGSKFVMTNAEFRFPLTDKDFPNHKTSGVFFFDAGGIWQSGETPRLRDFFSSVGFGVRVRLPVIGVTRFDLAVPLQRIGTKKSSLHISLGHTF